MNGHDGTIGDPCCARRSGRRSFRCATRRSNECANAFRHRADGAVSEQAAETNDEKGERRYGSSDATSSVSTATNARAETAL